MAFPALARNLRKNQVFTYHHGPGMKKKIPVEQLKVGMYVSELDRPQLTPLEFRGFRIRSQTQIDKLKRYCRSVYIETPQDHSHPNGQRPTAGKWPPSKAFTSERQRKLEFEMLKLGATPGDTSQQYQDRTTIDQEINTSRTAYEATRTLMRKAMPEIRQGADVDVGGVKKAIVPLVASAVRNADALVCFAQLRRRFDYTALHSVRVCLLALAFGRHLGLPIADLITLGMGALLHDIGKMKVPEDILNKPGSLTEDELELAKKHVQAGVQLLRRSNGIPAVALDVARYHHERYDGSGYPHRLHTRQIPYLGQIGAIVDCYDALTSDRPYALAVSGHTALQKIYEWRDHLFDKQLVEQFIQCMGIYPIGSIVELRSGDVGVVVSVNRVRRLKPRVRLVLRPDRTPYLPTKTVNLLQTEDSQSYEIERVAEPGAYSISPAEYLRVTTHH
jgi:putative nucleotidyltransferase with HDIG domain